MTVLFMHLWCPSTTCSCLGVSVCVPAMYQPCNVVVCTSTYYVPGPPCINMALLRCPALPHGGTGWHFTIASIFRHCRVVAHQCHHNSEGLPCTDACYSWCPKWQHGTCVLMCLLRPNSSWKTLFGHRPHTGTTTGKDSKLIPCTCCVPETTRGGTTLPRTQLLFPAQRHGHACLCTCSAPRLHVVSWAGLFTHLRRPAWPCGGMRTDLHIQDISSC